MSNNICPKCSWFFRADGTCACQNGEVLRQTAHTGTLPESKPEKRCENCVNPGCGGPVERGFCGFWQGKPEKNCGNCVIAPEKSNYGEPCSSCKEYSNWQPKAAEPQSWEQRLNGKFSADFYAMATKHMDNVRAFIRAEIERAGEEEKEKGLECLKYEIEISKQDDLPNHVDALSDFEIKIEQNKHRR